MGERVRRIFVVCTVLALVGTACGSRVQPLRVDGAIGSDPGSIGNVDGGGPGSGPIGGATGPTGGSGPVGGPSGTSGPIGGAACRATRSTDVGVTRDTIKLGLVASITGPLPGQFNSAVEAVDSYFKAVNAAGGICGRRVRLLVRDDNGDGNTNLQVATQLAEEEKVFAFVGGTSAPDDSGLAKVSRKHKIPDIGFPLTWERSENPYSYGVPGQLRRNIIGDGANGIPWYNRTYGIKQMALFWLRESEVSILNAYAFETTAIRMAEREGRTLKICHEQASGVVDNNYDSYVVSMAGKCDPADGPVAVYTTMENNANLKLAQAMHRQGFKPRVFVPTFTSYQESFVRDSQGRIRPETEGAFITIPQVPFERVNRPRSEWTPGTYEVKRYLDTLKRYTPRHVAPGSFGAPGWGMASLFTHVAAACGAELTRRCVIDKLETMPPFSANGMLSPTRPGDHNIYSADLVVQVRNGTKVEVRPHDRSGPKEAPDFWDDSELYDWWKYYCANKSKFPNTAAKDRYIRC